MTFTSELQRLNTQQMTLQDALVLVQEHANKDWYAAALKQVHWLCLSIKEFPTDDVHAVLDRMDVTTPEARAMGSVMTEAMKKGWCKATGQYKATVRPEAHRRPIRIWESLL